MNPAWRRCSGGKHERRRCSVGDHGRRRCSRDNHGWRRCSGASGAHRERRVRERERFGGCESAGQRPLWAWDAERGAWGGVSGASSPAHLRSSNRASQWGRAESHFWCEVGSARWV
jgi:hypothetical protein